MTPSTTIPKARFGRLPPLHLTISGVTVASVLIIWQLAVQYGYIKPIFLPSPSAIFDRGVAMFDDGSLFLNVLASTRRVMVGFVLAALVSIPLGILMGSSKLCMSILGPFLTFLRPLPSMAWIPLSLLWFGITETQKYSIVFMGSIAPSLLYVIDATRSVDPLLVRAARNLGAGQRELMFGIILPAALPQIMTGMRVMLGVAWTCVISAELVAAREGLGYMIMNGREFFQTDTVVLGMVLISVTVLITNFVMRFIERSLIVWQD
ncbi:ABC transporter permease [Burkholderia anthina]|uniref:ABC transporter permease n=1 Tax=Burkholderia anthina TaxID=179879 RepID=UPI001AA0757A|nr:ABC transporter permease [Burkholderia anthina]QTD94931.1 ABC transporter permease [Burkholderia anthina]